MDPFLTKVGICLAQLLKSLLALLNLAFQQVAARLGLTPGQGTKLSDSAAKKARRKKKKASGDAQATTAGAEAAPAQQSAAATAGAAAAAAAWSESESEEEEEPDTAAAGVPRGAWVGASYADSLTAGAAGWESAARPRKKAAGSSQATAGTFPASRRPAVPGQRHHKGPVHECARPGCGAAGKKGFRKCRCGKVWYCTPACSASDWPRHQLECE